MRCDACGMLVPDATPLALALHVKRRCPCPSDRAVAAAMQVLDEHARARDAEDAARRAARVRP